MDSFISRLLLYIQSQGLSKRFIEQKCGIANGLIGKAELRGTGISTENVEKLLKGLPDLNPTWLMTGQGAMLLGARNTPTGTFVQEPGGDYQVAIPEESHAVPLLSMQDILKWMAGNREIAQYTATLRLPNLSSDEHIALQIQSDSMYPTLSSGDIVVARRMSTITRIQPGNLHIIHTLDQIVICRLYWDTEASIFSAVSDNLHYAAYKIPINEIVSLWEVVRAITTNLSPKRS